MVDFTKHLNIGLDAAKTAEDNRAEIDAVFDELNKQLLAATEGKVQIQRKEFRDGWQFTKNFQPVTYFALAVCSTIPTVNPTEIAKWNMARSGYPCEIELAGNGKWYCEDRKGLETAFGTLLQDPLVGETIQKYMRMPDRRNSAES
ncbi:hypothetical protein PCO31110_02107 [Pandoraea communis]|uniref:Uncharacterized protein n=1 Tax=Pandoraea communis TaxID=2508297 RepID=A0A5E4UL53_9BURK|nr:hypothetical protein [Pandoraea communis]VVE00253.1 hypothetical protein PCO31110_02107 [Pandoraea communis]